MDDASVIEESQSASRMACPSRRTPSAICCSSKAAYPGFTIDQFKVFAIKSRVHFRRGFDESVREDRPAGRAGAAVPRHGTARGATLPERRHLHVLSVR